MNWKVAKNPTDPRITITRYFNKYTISFSKSGDSPAKWKLTRLNGESIDLNDCEVQPLILLLTNGK